MVSHKRAPWRRRHRLWFWSIAGLVGLVIAGAIVNALIGPPTIREAAKTVQPTSRAPSATASPVPAVTATTPSSTTPSSTTPSSTTVAPTGDPSAVRLAQTGCRTFQSDIAPVIQRSVAANALVPIIRVSVGADPNSTAVQPYNPSGPYPASVRAVAVAATRDPSYQPVSDAFGALTTAILEVGPHRALQSVADAASRVSAACQAAHALP